MQFENSAPLFIKKKAYAPDVLRKKYISLQIIKRPLIRRRADYNDKKTTNDMKSKRLGLILLAVLPMFTLSCEDDSKDNGLQIKIDSKSGDLESYTELLEKLQSFIDARDLYINGLAELFNYSDPNITRGIMMHSKSFTYQSSDCYGNPITLSAIMAYPAGYIGGPKHSVSSILLAMPQHLPYEKDAFSESGSPIELRASLYSSLVIIPDGQGNGASQELGLTSDPVLSAKQALDAMDYAIKLAKDDPNISLSSDCPARIIGFGSDAVTACASAMMIEEGLYNFRYNSNKHIESVICAQTELSLSPAEYSSLSLAFRNWKLGTPIYFLHIDNDEIAPYSNMLNFKDDLSAIGSNEDYIHIERRELKKSNSAQGYNENANLYWLAYSIVNKILEF